MKILNFGSLNLDYTYEVEHIVREGETIDSLGLTCYPGGKGLNQSIALARAGAQIWHAGLIGPDGEELANLLLAEGINCTYIKRVAERTGNALIQVDKNGKNSIVLYGGANKKNSRAFCDEVLAGFEKGDMILLQNEMCETAYLIEKAWEKGMYIAFNPSPMKEEVLSYPLDKISLFLLNEHEGAMIAKESSEQNMMDQMYRQFPNAEIVVTLGEKGSIYKKNSTVLKQEAIQVRAVDTTAAGDTFTGYFLSEKAKGRPAAECLLKAAQASAIAVTKNGASVSIPMVEEVDRFENGNK
ncbi:MAG: ribokinase [Lachnospiraceae bacterium]